jgi:large subunit ribosomal protein L11
MGKKTVSALIDGGKATPAPPLGPTLSVFKVNIGKIIQDINEKTKEYEGMKVPVNIIIDDKTKEYEIEIGVPPVSSLIRKELGLKKIAEEKKEEEKTEVVEETKEEVIPEEKEKPKFRGKEEEKTEVVEETKEEVVEVKKERVMVGNLTINQAIKITKMKRSRLLAKDSKKALKEIVSSCVSMPITVEGKSPKEVIKEIDEGKYDELIKKEFG